MTLELKIRYDRRVKNALKAGKPVVALESTIITHGMPWPQNVEMAQNVEAIIRQLGAEPATIAIIEGELNIGLSADALTQLAQSQNVMKLSRADLPFAIAAGKTGATTVAATMIAAQKAGISVFATGGIGGVHRGVEKSFDISADLSELARTNVIVVSAGPKAILDTPKTLEYLETQGVPVITYCADNLPAFWSTDSGMPSPLRLDTAKAIAAMKHAKDAMGLSNGMLIANPVPVEFEIPGPEMSTYIEQAIKEAEADGVSGKDLTPWLLGRIFELTDGASLKTNIALVENNARLAAEIALAL